jgi:hypothetical protein
MYFEVLNAVTELDLAQKSCVDFGYGEAASLNFALACCQSHASEGTLCEAYGVLRREADHRSEDNETKSQRRRKTDALVCRRSSCKRVEVSGPNW